MLRAAVASRSGDHHAVFAECPLGADEVALPPAVFVGFRRVVLPVFGRGCDVGEVHPGGVRCCELARCPQQHLGILVIGLATDDGHGVRLPVLEVGDLVRFQLVGIAARWSHRRVLSMSWSTLSHLDRDAWARTSSGTYLARRPLQRLESTL